MKITSPAFGENSMIPSKYTCDGENISPPLTIDDVPDMTRSLALIMDDPDAPTQTWVHWVVWNIYPSTRSIAENSEPGISGTSDFETTEYGGPCPPSGTHRYFFKIYALDTMLDLPRSTTKQNLEKTMEGHILASGEFFGSYQRK